MRYLGSRTLSFPSMRIPKFSYNHTEMVARDCRSLKMKLMGGRRTKTQLAAVASHACGSGRTLSSAAA